MHHFTLASRTSVYASVYIYIALSPFAVSVGPVRVVKPVSTDSPVSPDPPLLLSCFGNKAEVGLWNVQLHIAHSLLYFSGGGVGGWVV